MKKTSILSATFVAMAILFNSSFSLAQMSACEDLFRGIPDDRAIREWLAQEGYIQKPRILMRFLRRYMTIRLENLPGVSIEFQEFEGMPGYGSHGMRDYAKMLKVRLEKDSPSLPAIERTLIDLRNEIAREPALLDLYSEMESQRRNAAWWAQLRGGSRHLVQYHTRHVAKGEPLYDENPIHFHELQENSILQKFWSGILRVSSYQDRDDGSVILVIQTRDNPTYISVLNRLKALEREK